jgi:cyclophilin family peptidyl-prolyl cis-trans isomerase
VLAQLLDAFPDEIRFIYRHFPLTFHDKASLATQASEAAELQGAFWDIYYLLYETQGEWSAMSPDDFSAWIIGQAEALELDPVQFEADMFSEDVLYIANYSFNKAIENEVGYTPFFEMDGAEIESNYLTVGLFEQYFLPLADMQDKMFTECPEITIDEDLNYTATLVTEKGDIVLGLFPEIAPFAVNSFIFLAENDFYDNVPFHRVLENFMAQAGDPSGTGLGYPGYYFSLEVSPDLTFDREGLLAMANSGPTTNGSQFFITVDAQEHLNGNYTIFGEVLEGLDVVKSLTLRDPNSAGVLPEPDYILDVIIEVSD